MNSTVFNRFIAKNAEIDYIKVDTNNNIIIFINENNIYKKNQYFPCFSLSKRN